MLISGAHQRGAEIAEEGLAVTPKRFTRSRDWIELTVSEVAFNLGDWKLSRETLCPPPARLSGVALIFRQIRGAELALGEGDDEAAELCLDSIEDLVSESSEPQWIAAYGVLVGESAAPPARLRPSSQGGRTRAGPDRGLHR